MKLKDELEILLGEPLKLFDGDPLRIPCIETSDAEKLCRNPVVSVNMITYNHEPYIRQAIEGVLMQQTDFEFELVIGEDCSQDRTREICFEYQRRFPDKIRVLWWHENVLKLGGNDRRVTAHCRGKYIALCEGDDYWTDPFKLKKQVTLIEESNCVGCVAFNSILKPDGTTEDNIYLENKSGYVGSQDFFRHYFHTSTYIFARAMFQKMLARYILIPYWYDTMLFHCMADMGKIALLPEVVSVRRMSGRGVATSLSSQGRVVLGLKQNIPMYLWGPVKGKEQFGMSILTIIPFFFYRKGLHYSASLTARYGKTMMNIFISVFRDYWWKGYAWGRLLRLIKYRGFSVGYSF